MDLVKARKEITEMQEALKGFAPLVYSIVLSSYGKDKLFEWLECNITSPLVEISKALNAEADKGNTATNDNGLIIKPLIVPTVGRLVWYKHQDSIEPLAAIICGVDNTSNNFVNLSLFKPTGLQEALVFVPMYQGTWETCPVGSCCWMPYQRDQAAKELVSDMKPAPVLGLFY